MPVIGHLGSASDNGSRAAQPTAACGDTMAGMVLNHVAAILVCSGPLFYIGLWMVLDPAGIAGLIEFVVRVSRNLVRSLGGRPAEENDEPAVDSRRLRTGLRLAGLALLLVAIVV